MISWLEITKDKYELPVAVAETEKELAELRKVTIRSITKSLKNAKKQKYICIEVDDD